MKNLIQTTLIFFALILCSNSIFCQANNPQINVEYKAWIKSMDGKQNKKGYLAELKDSTIVFGTKQNIENIAVTNLQELKFRKKNTIRRGMAYGALIGFGLGAIIGYASGDDKCTGFLDLFCYSAEEKALLTGIGMGISGTLIGALVGSAKVKIPINGKMNHYEKQRINLKKYSVMD